MSVYTSSLVGNLLRELIENELDYVKRKDSLRYRVSWNNQDAWNTVNKLGLHKIGAVEFKAFLQDHRTVATADEVDRLLKRFGGSELY